MPLVNNRQFGFASARGGVQLNVVIAIVFATVLAGLIWYFDQSDPGFHRQALKKMATRLEHNAGYAHWQWQSENQPPRIMMVHYDAQDREKSRRPLAIASFGYPRVADEDDACDTLWSQLLDEPMEVEGFRVKGRYVRGDLENGEAVNAYCRFSISSGDRFDYIIRTGKIDW